MKYGIRNTSLKMSWRDALKMAAKMGFDGVELVVSSEEELEKLSTAEGQGEVNAWLAEYAVEASSLSIAPFRKHHFGLGIEEGARFVSKCLHACSEVGATAILLPHFDRNKIDLNAPEERSFIDGLKMCAPLAEELNRVIALETSFSADQLARIIDRTGSKYVGVYQDLANAVIYGHDPVDMVERLGSRISMVHIKELSAELLGEGAMEWDDLTRALRAIGYDGWLVLETSATDKPLLAARKNLEFIRSAMGASSATNPSPG